MLVSFGVVCCLLGVRALQNHSAAEVSGVHSSNGRSIGDIAAAGNAQAPTPVGFANNRNRIRNIVVGIPTLEENVADHVPPIHETWAADFEHVHFYSSIEYQHQPCPERTAALNNDNQPAGALTSARVHNIGTDHALSAAYSLFKEHPDAAWYVIASEHSFVDGARLADMLDAAPYTTAATASAGNAESGDDWYIGMPSRLKVAHDEYEAGPDASSFCSGSAGYVLSNSLMQKIAPHLLEPMTTCCADVEVGELVRAVTGGTVECSAPQAAAAGALEFVDASRGSGSFLNRFDGHSALPVRAVEEVALAYGGVTPLNQFRYHRRVRRRLRQQRQLQQEQNAENAEEEDDEAEQRELLQLYPSYQRYQPQHRRLAAASSSEAAEDRHSASRNDVHAGRPVHGHSHAQTAPAYHPRVAALREQASAAAAAAATADGSSNSSTAAAYVQPVCGEAGYKCVISMGLYGNNPKYTTGAVRNAWLVREVYPGWILRFNYDKDSVPPQVLDTLRKYGAELLPYDKAKFSRGISGMYARFLVAEDDTVDRYIVRDSDSRLNWREKHAVNEWIASGFSIHSLRDHPGHGRPMNGGMWGGVKGAVKGLLSKMLRANQNTYNEDQKFLCNSLFPEVENDQISHDSTYCTTFKNAHPYPTRRYFHEHVGQVFSAEEAPVMGHINTLLDDLNMFDSPVACRRHPHWTKG